MKAALKDQIGQYVIWEGPDQSYPKWFEESILPMIVFNGEMLDLSSQDNDYYTITELSTHVKENGYILIPGYDVFIKRGRRIFRTNYDVFNRLYESESLGGNVCALREDCIDYYWFDPSVPIHETPKWIKEEVIDGRIFEFYDGAWYYYDLEGDVAVSPHSVFLRNKKNRIKHIDLDTFINVYYSEQTMFLMCEEI